jgi:hypothetical protein
MKIKSQIQRSLHPRAIQALRHARAHVRDASIQIQRLFVTLGFPMRLFDNLWFELQLKPKEAFRLYKIPLPSLPPDNVQLMYTARTGRENLRQAFHFYKYICSIGHLKQIKNPYLLDFGGGWGRVSRFFLRDTKPEFIWIADCMSDSLYWLRETRNPCNLIKNNAMPPIQGLQTLFHVIYAFSVFSHLSQKSCDAWITYLLNLLHPGGLLIITTRGRAFMNDRANELLEKRKSHLADYLPLPAELWDRYEKGQFQFYSTGVGGELSSEFGEAIIPRSYFEENYGATLVDFTEDVSYVDQAVVVLQRK